MKFFEVGTLIIIVVSIVTAIGASSYFWGGPDNQVEEACEDIIHVITGVDIDLSPGTPEEKEVKDSIDENAVITFLEELIATEK